MRRLAALQLCAALLLLAICVPARADVFGPISLVSNEAVLAGGRCVSCEQVEYAHDPAISENGEYVAFDGYFDGLTGVWRRDLKTGVVDPVAVGEPGTPAGSGELPSISASGQYISFTTRAALTPGDENVGPDVYVRDMEKEPTEAEPPQGGAFTLASAVNGSAQGLTYAYPKGERSEEEDYGAMAAGRSALTANGQEVVFVTTAPSNLEGEATPETPALEVAVRDIGNDETKPVSVEYDRATGKPVIEDGKPVPVPTHEEGGHTYGAVYSASKPPAFRPPEPYQPTSQVPASISANGSTVAWLAHDVGEQAQALAAESLKPEYSEPLWRRIEDGEEAPTRRVTGGSDPADTTCVASGESVLPLEPSLSDPCQGPFRTTENFGTWDGGEGDVVPRLSADGYTVAFIASAPLVSLGNDFGSGLGARKSDLYVADMHEGLSRVQALTPLTELASGEEGEIAPAGPIIDLGISPDGSQVALTTKRTIFPLGSPAYVSAPAAVPGMLELFDVDLADDTLTRVTRGYEGGPSEQPHLATKEEDQYPEPGDGALSPSFSKDGDLLAFSSTASNLVYGDGNTPPLGINSVDGSDVFVVQREQFNPVAAPQVISSAPPAPSLVPLWGLWASAISLPDGSVRLYVEVPGAGTLRAIASGAVAVRTARSSRGARTTRHRKAANAHTSQTVLTRDVAATTLAGEPGGAGLMTLVLTLSPSYRSLAAQPEGLSATASVTFTAAGHPVLRQSIAVSFLRKAKANAARRSRASAGARSRAKGHRGR
jgi:hypothetical protein